MWRIPPPIAARLRRVRHFSARENWWHFPKAKPGAVFSLEIYIFYIVYGCKHMRLSCALNHLLTYLLTYLLTCWDIDSWAWPPRTTPRFVAVTVKLNIWVYQLELSDGQLGYSCCPAVPIQLSWVFSAFSFSLFDPIYWSRPSTHATIWTSAGIISIGVAGQSMMQWYQRSPLQEQEQKGS